MKIYLAHNFAARTMLATSVVPKLEGMGHTVTSRWITQVYVDRSPRAQRIYAEEDCYDIYVSDAMIYFADQFGETPGRGKHFELGLAYARYKKIFIVSDHKASVFYFLRGMIPCNTIEEVYEILGENQTKKDNSEASS